MRDRLRARPIRGPVPGRLEADRVLIDDPTEASQTYNRGYFGQPLRGGALALSLLEAVYLREAGRLEVHRGGRPLPMRDLVRSAHRAYPQFEIKYVVYRDLRQRGYVAEEDPGPFDFRVLPRGGAPGKTPAKHWATAVSEGSVFDLEALAAQLAKAAGARKNFLLAVVDEESDLTYYAAREVEPRGHEGARPTSAVPTAHLLEDRAMVVDEAEAAALSSSGFYGKMVGRRLQLSLIETAHLLRRGEIALRSADTDRRVGMPRLLREARRIQPDFDLRLRVYEDLRGRGIVAKTGFKYGSHFRAYDGNPETHHARYLVHALPARYRGMWPEVSRAVRLAHGVKKQLLFAAAGESIAYLRLERVRP